MVDVFSSDVGAAEFQNSYRVLGVRGNSSHSCSFVPGSEGIKASEDLQLHSFIH